MKETLQDVTSKVGMIVTATFPSPSGAYRYLLGHHYSKGHTCWDVCAVCLRPSPRFNIKAGEIIKRHHHTKEEALVTWAETTKRLTEIDQIPEEKDEKEPFIYINPPSSKPS